MLVLLNPHVFARKLKSHRVPRCVLWDVAARGVGQLSPQRGRGRAPQVLGLLDWAMEHSGESSRGWLGFLLSAEAGMTVGGTFGLRSSFRDVRL